MSHRPLHIMILLSGILTCLLRASPVLRGDPGGETVECGITHATAEHLYLDAGSARGLKPGDVGSVRQGDVEAARVEVIQATTASAIVRLVAANGGAAPRAGDRVVFVVASRPGEEQTAASTSPTAASPRSAEEEFVPLLAPPRRQGRFPSPSNLFHGRLRAQEIYQLDAQGDNDYSLTRLATDGALERIQGSPWALDWSGAVSYRTGDGFDGSPDEDELRVDVYRVSLFRRFDGGERVRAGRFLPYELPGVGYIDGAQGDLPVTEWLRLGAIAGLKPRRRDLAPSIDEPTGSLYGTVELGKPRELYYTGTLGALGSFYEGDFDRLAILLDHRLDLGSKLSLFSTSAVDFDVGQMEVREGVRLTRADIYAVSPVTSWLTLRAGADHYERPDTAAERGQLAIVDDRYFDRGYARYWTGATVRLPSRFSLDGEVALIDAPDETSAIRWRAGVARFGTFLPNDHLLLTVYSLAGFDAEGYGARLTATLPFLEDRLSLRPSAGFRFVDTDETDEASVTDVTLFADYWISQAWSIYAGATWAFGDDLDATVIDLGVEFRW